MKKWVAFIGFFSLFVIPLFMVTYYPVVMFPAAYRSELAKHIGPLFAAFGAIMGSRVIKKYGSLFALLIMIWPLMTLMSYLMRVSMEHAWHQVTDISINIYTVMFWILAGIVGWIAGRMSQRLNISIPTPKWLPRIQTQQHQANIRIER